MLPTPFTISIPDSAIIDLKERLARTRWPDQLEGIGWEAGADITYLKDLARYWQRDFDWRAQEARLNQLAQFTAEIDGHRIHFVHERAKNGCGIPLIITHGWPGSFLEMEKIVPLLTDPDGRGAAGAPAFDVVVPSLPGFGFSGRPRREGVDEQVIADLWAKLMTALGYKRFAAQGGDWGAGVTFRLGQRHRERILGLLFNTIPSWWVRYSQSDLTDEEKAAFAHGAKWDQEEYGYGHEQRTKPQTLAYGLNDSPIGLAAWIVEKFHGWSDCDGDVETAFTRDDILTNVSIYWFTETIGSSMRIYREFRLAPRAFAFGDKIDLPAAFANFPKEQWLPPRSYVERVFTDVRRWTNLSAGGHFGAMEQPHLLAEESRAFFGALT